MALYSDSADEPGSMLATTAEFVDPNAVQWHDIALVSSYGVTDTVKYWIIIWVDTDGSSSQRLVRTDTGQSTTFAYKNGVGAINTGSWPTDFDGTADRNMGLMASYD